MKQYQTLFYAKQPLIILNLHLTLGLDGSLLIPAELKKSLNHPTAEHHTYVPLQKTNCFDVTPNLKTDQQGVKRHLRALLTA